MSISVEMLQNRRDQLAISLEASEETLEDLKDRLKVVKKEIVNCKGAIMELDKLIEMNQ